jgi:hypothetical protein
VFPLRTYHLALAWLARAWLPPTLEGFHAMQHVVTYLHVGGAAFLTYAWTRSSAWGLLAGLSFLLFVFNPVSTIDLGSRHAMQLWLAGLALEVLRHRGWVRAGLVALLGVVAAGVGYDGHVPVLAALGPAIALSDPQAPRGMQGRRPRWTNALVVEGILVAAPTLLLALWQGPRAASDYWTLLVDSARHMSAHYGQPLQWEQFPLLVPCLLALAACSIAGVIRWSRLSPFQRAGSLVLLIVFLLVLHRATARSSGVNYRAGDLPCETILVLCAFELLSVLRRWTGRAWWNDRTIVALAASAWLAMRLPQTLSDPLTLMRQLRSLSPVEVLRQPPEDLLFGSLRSPDVARMDRDWQLIRSRVGPGETLWAIEDALANYLCERHNPTRHAIAYTICSPAEQRRAVRDLQRAPPRLVSFQPFAIDDIPFSLRYYVVSPFLFEHYQPAEEGFLEPRHPGWVGYDRFPEQWGFPLELGRLAARWGAERLPLVACRRTKRLPEVRWSRDAGERLGRAHDIWECDVALSPSQFNYVALRMSPGAAMTEGEVFEGRLAFASPDSEWDATNRITWTMVAGDDVLLLPVGCCPGWAWRRSIERLQLLLPAEQRRTPPDVELMWIDELAGP